LLGLLAKDELNPSDGPPNESAIRKAYFRLANKYHPDKNPTGRDMFERVNKAYEFLCAASKIQQGPNEFNIYLLLKTQTILYRRYKTLLSEYKYAGYPMLIRILETEAKNDQLFSMGNTTKSTALLPIAIELLYYTIDCTELNSEELRRENGLEILTQIFQRCSSVITKSSKSDDFVVIVCQYSALCYSVAGHFEKSRDLFVDPDKLQCVLKELCHCLNYIHLKQLCICTCKAAMSLCNADVRLRDILHRYGLFVYACRGLFNYDYTLDESGIADASNKQYIDNQLAFDYLQTLASLIKDNPPATIAAQTFLTPYIVSQLPDRSVLKLLNSNQEQAYLIWDNSCRQELIDKMDETRDYLVKNDYKLDIDKFGNPSEFQYSAYKNELIIGEIFVRIYNLQPTTILKDPKKFCLDLLDYLGSSSQYINTLMSMQIQQNLNDDKKSSEGLHLDKQTYISQALEALKNVIRNNLGTEILCIGHFKLLFSLLRMENVGRLQQYALELILHISGSNECVNDISQSNVIVYLLLVLRSSISNQETTLEILNALSSNGKIARDIVDSGGLLYLLDIFTNGQNSNLREYAANVLSKLMNDRLHGPRIRLQLIKYLPNLVVDAMRESCETSIQLFETTHENPELIWNDHTREMTCERIGKQLNEFYSKQRINPTEIKWSVDDSYQLLSDDEETQRIRDNELIIAGVYIRLLIANPGWIVRRPKEFLTELLSRWTTHTK
jgi:DnaJ family protein C protein 13